MSDYRSILKEAEQVIANSERAILRGLRIEARNCALKGEVFRMGWDDYEIILSNAPFPFAGSASGVGGVKYFCGAEIEVA